MAKALVDTGGFWARTARIGESIAQRSRRSQRGIEDMAEKLWWTRRLLGENCANRGKHRTEVTEVTEGESGDRRQKALVNTRLLGENSRIGGKHRTEVTEVTEGEPEDDGERLYWTRRLLGEKRANRGKHRTEVTEVTEGELGMAGKGFGGHGGFRARTARIGESIAQRSRRSQRGKPEDRGLGLVTR